MKICLVGPGLKPIPPMGWGAVESLVWDYYEVLKQKGYDVEICNHSTPSDMIYFINSRNFSIVHIMYDDHIYLVPYIEKHNTRILYTSHFAYITHPNFAEKYQSYFNNIFTQVIRMQHAIHSVHSISVDIRKRYIEHGMSEEKVKVIPNGARDDKFIYHREPSKTNKSIYLAKVETRKRQFMYQNISSIDFVGNYHDSSFDIGLPNYLGEWSKEALYQNLSHYGNLILLSDGEADPLVVKEALVCGLGVVLSKCSAANLDRSKGYITIIPDDKLQDIEYVEEQISMNRVVSIER